MTALTEALERALLRELRAAWQQLNATYFREALTAPTFELGVSTQTLGRFVAATRTLELSRALVVESPWGVVIEVLKHEMAHQYVHEVLGEHGETAHGPAFRATCRRLGIDGRAAGVPSVDPEAPPSAEARAVERIARLLALAESPNRHEAEAAALAAQRLMLKYNLEALRDGVLRDHGHRHLGRPTGRVTEAERLLAMILGKHFFVEVIWVPAYRPLEGRRGSVLEICGTSANLAMAEYVHGFLTHTASRLWEEHKRASAIRGDRDRRTFLAGVMAGFAEKLRHQAKANEETGLVWVRDGDLHAYFRRRHPYVRHVRHAGHRRNDAFARGREAGQAIVLHRGVGASVTATARGRLLGR